MTTQSGSATESPAPVDAVHDPVIGAALLAGTANIIMQLAHPAVGYGVYESKVESGQIFRHPVKRSRTTLTYLVVATLATDEERALFGRGINKAHAHVRSTPSSPVAYNAFDPELQLWVAACLYKGVEDTNAAFAPPLDDAAMERIYQEASSFGTTLQVPRERWPADREAFHRFWEESLARISIDDTIRHYLHDLAMLRFMPRFVSIPLGPLNRFITTGFLPQRVREEMRLPWDAARQRRFDVAMSALGAVTRRLPRPLREFPLNTLLWDLRRRIRTGRPLV